MTFAEKETVIAAMRCYMDKLDRDIRRYEKRGESGKASEAHAARAKANAIMFEFAQLLSIPAGRAKI